MNTSKLDYILKRVYSDPVADKRDIKTLLSLSEDAHTQQLFDFADNVRKNHTGDGILLRGIVEFSNHCKNGCLYCGLNKDNKSIARYRLTQQQVLDCIEHIHRDGIKTVVLQSGEDDLNAQWLAEVIKEAKSRFGIAVTLSLGERTEHEYRIWKDAGADRYLLKIETTNKAAYSALHPDMDFDNRVKCLRTLKKLGYQTGSGCIVGVKGQTIDTLAGDILFFAAKDIDMIGIGPFIPHQDTKLRSDKQGQLDMVLKALAVTRIVTKNAHLPATTAIGSIGKGDGRLKALKAGANVLMPNYTPLEYKKLYEIYPGKRCVKEPAGACQGCMENMADSLGRYIDYSIGHSLKKQTSYCAAQI